MKVLVINCGSSSLKYQLIDMDTNNVMAKGLCDRIAINDSELTHTVNGVKTVIKKDMPDHAAAVEMVIAALTDSEHGVIKDMSEVSAVGHRLVHGGEKFAGSVLINDEVMATIEECVPLAPLHNPANIIGIDACRKAMPNVPMVAVFDTAFHQTMPADSYMYAIPYEYYEKFKIRRYGFHGTSHKYVAQRAAEILGKKLEDLKIVNCHLGSGSSICAIDCGKSVDTTMGFTPLAGLEMGTRCGDIDPAIVTFLMDNEKLSTKEIDSILNKKAGFLGLSGVSNDCRDVEAAAKDGNERADIALKVFIKQVKKYIGAYAAEMGGIDVLTFTAGIGENTIWMREAICEGLEYMGIKVDAEKNNCRGKEVDISADGATVTTMVVPTNEELMIAIETVELL
ncbi:MAG: acetate kinase [Clostridia bacterium]|nr:acetate kinase [Clostridia bacterium]